MHCKAPFYTPNGRHKQCVSGMFAPSSMMACFSVLFILCHLIWHRHLVVAWMEIPWHDNLQGQARRKMWRKMQRKNAAKVRRKTSPGLEDTVSAISGNFRKLPEIAGNLPEIAGNCWRPGGGGGAAISGNFRKFCQKFPAISGNCRKLPRTAFLGKIGGNFRNCWKLPEISGNYRKFPEIAGNFRNCRKLRKFPEIAGHARPPGPLFDPHLPLFQARPLFGPPFSPHPWQGLL